VNRAAHGRRDPALLPAEMDAVDLRLEDIAALDVSGQLREQLLAEGVAERLHLVAHPLDPPGHLLDLSPLLLKLLFDLKPLLHFLAPAVLGQGPDGREGLLSPLLLCDDPVYALQPASLLRQALEGCLGLAQGLFLFAERRAIQGRLRLVEPPLDPGRLGLRAAVGEKGPAGKHRIDPLRGRAGKPQVLLLSLQIRRVQGGVHFQKGRSLRHVVALLDADAAHDTRLQRLQRLDIAQGDDLAAGRNNHVDLDEEEAQSRDDQEGHQDPEEHPACRVGRTLLDLSQDGLELVRLRRLRSPAVCKDGHRALPSS